MLFLCSLCLVMACVSGRPNVLFMIVDDLSTEITSYDGMAQAPNMARLAKLGSQFQSAYVSVPICAPSRTAFLTGLRPDVTQVYVLYQGY